MPTVIPFASRLRAPHRDHCFAMDDYWLWCGSMAHDDTGLWHLFASRWPRSLPFFDGYKVASEVIRATAPAPEGPWTFAEVVLPDRGPDCWDGRMTHNPVVLRAAGRWWLFYIGATYPGARPTAAQLAQGWPELLPTFRRIRIGCAVADQPQGPWQRPDTPYLDSRAGGWDDGVVTNPAPCLAPDGRLLLLYRGNMVDTQGVYQGSALGLATAPAPGQPPDHRCHQPIFFGDLANRIEDPCLWWDGQGYQMIAKDLTGALAGAHGYGVHAWSPDGAHWHLAVPPRAWQHDITWADGGQQQLGSLERPQLVFAHGGHEPSHLVCAMGDGSGSRFWQDMTRSWCQIIPLGGVGSAGNGIALRNR